MGSQVCAIRKAIRPPFADPVTNMHEPISYFQCLALFVLYTCHLRQCLTGCVEAFMPM